MRQGAGQRRGPACLALAVLALAGAGVPAQGQDKAPRPLPPEVVQAWEKAGAAAGWMSRGQYGMVFRSGAKGKAGEVPAFLVFPWKEGVLAKLPPPPGPFGLDLSNSAVTDAGLK